MTEDKGARRAIATFISIVVIVIIMAIYGCVRDDDRAKAEERIYQGVPLNKHLLELDKQALEAAYKDHLKLLFSVWLKDDVSVVHRINEGLRRARRAYDEASARIQEREKQP